MRSDCVNDCYQDKLRKLCKVDHGLFMSESLIRKEYLWNGYNRLISCYDEGYNRQSYTIKQDCEQTCKVECNEKYYPIEIERKTHNFENNKILIRHGESW